MATTQKIRYSDCDPQGVVFNGNYARYWDDALTDWFEEAGYGGAELGGSGVDVVRVGTTSMTVGLSTRRLSDDTVVTEGREILVFVDPHDFRPTAVPESIKSDLAPESG
jgi:acyl-CoA thioester hydrolase